MKLMIQAIHRAIGRRNDKTKKEQWNNEVTQHTRPVNPVNRPYKEKYQCAKAQPLDLHEVGKQQQDTGKCDNGDIAPLLCAALDTSFGSSTPDKVAPLRPQGVAPRPDKQKGAG